MPELPEVETMRRGVLPVVGATIVRAARSRCEYQPIRVTPALAVWKRRVAGQRIAAVERVGKRLVLRLGNDERIVFEPRMTGLVLLANPPNRAHLRFRLQLADAPVSELLFWDRRGLGVVRLFTAAEFAAQLGSDKIGPDALAMNAAAWRRQLGASPRAIKVALLDQRAVAGIGNLYASEILHLARIDPRTPCHALSAADWRQIDRRAREVLEAAIRHEGSTLSDGTYRNALNEAGSYQNLHRVYDRAGQRCPRCRAGVIERIVQAQRSTFFCARCQFPR